jgi:rubrerythrin
MFPDPKHRRIFHLHNFMGCRMDIFKYAREIELQSEQLYRDLATQSPIQEIASIFGFLAGEERRHCELLRTMSRHAAFPSIEKSSILIDSKAAFKNLSEHFTAPGTIAVDREYALGAALDFEKKSISLYEKALMELAPGSDDERSRPVLLQILEQEKNHARLVESLMEFHRHPHEWLENAEWNHLDEF